MIITVYLQLRRMFGFQILFHPGFGAGIRTCLLIVGSALANLVFGQSNISFSSDGYTHQAEISWGIKHNNAEFRADRALSFDRAADGTFDLAVNFKFKYDSIPADQDLLWGFQFAQNGGLITPASSEKKSRSMRLFQRFQLNSIGSGSLVISPKIWKRSRSGQFEVVALAAPFKLDFTVLEGDKINPEASTPLPESPPVSPIQGKEIPIPVSVQESHSAPEIEEYRVAMGAVDSTEKIKALLDFVDKYAPDKPKSPLVAEAIKNVPLGTSLPQNAGKGTYSYTLNYAVNPVIDSSKVRGWQWDLSQEGAGRYQLTLRDLGDSVHQFSITDIGKNAPYNRPKEIRPFDKIQVHLIKEDRSSFVLRFAGGTPPFIVFLSQNRIPKARFVVNATDTLWSVQKDACVLCKNGPHTLEVYNSDFSTLLLRIDKGIQITRINYYLLGITGIALLLLIYFLYKPLTRIRQRYVYEKTLRDIENWEKRDSDSSR